MYTTAEPLPITVPSKESRGCALLGSRTEAPGWKTGFATSSKADSSLPSEEADLPSGLLLPNSPPPFPFIPILNGPPGKSSASFPLGSGAAGGGAFYERRSPPRPSRRRESGGRGGGVWRARRGKGGSGETLRAPARLAGREGRRGAAGDASVPWTAPRQADSLKPPTARLSRPQPSPAASQLPRFWNLASPPPPSSLRQVRRRGSALRMLSSLILCARPQPPWPPGDAFSGCGPK